MIFWITYSYFIERGSVRITFLLSTLDQMRFMRISELEKLGARSKILAFDRSYYAERWHKKYEYQIIGKLQNMKYFKRD